MGIRFRLPTSLPCRNQAENLALSPLGERVACDGVFFSRRGTGLRPPKGHRRSGLSASYGPQAGEGVDKHRIRPSVLGV